MPAPVKVRLTAEERDALLKVSLNGEVPPRTRTRAMVISMISTGRKVEQVAEEFSWAQSTIRKTIYRWYTSGIEGLFDQKRTGRKPKWKQEDWAEIEECIEKEQRTYNSQQIVELLKEKRQVELSRDRVRKILKKKSIDIKE
jgi:transposase